MSTLQSPTLTRSRTVEHVLAGQPTSDGAGVRINRVVDHRMARRLDPFLMLDNFGSHDPKDYLAGFPSHPHRGFETVTYMIAGRMRHRDSAGNEGLLQNGGVQWMTAGRGVIHSEMPEQEEGHMEGFQLWLNLPAKDKMRDPWYRDIPHEELPAFETDAGVKVWVIAGRSHGLVGAVEREGTEPIYVDAHLPAGARFTQELPPGHNAFLFVYRGAVKVDGRVVKAGFLGILANEPTADGVAIDATEDSKLVLIAGRPLQEPIAQYGPFVMNNEAEIRQAIADFQQGRLA
jgi:quercetin 2,3-dioxygenase